MLDSYPPPHRGRVGAFEARTSNITCKVKSLNHNRLVVLNRLLASGEKASFRKEKCYARVFYTNKEDKLLHFKSFGIMKKGCEFF